jgi:hypothetical protein
MGFRQTRYNIGQMAIELVIRHPDPSRKVIDGFRQLWAYYVRGFDPNEHCQLCLKGQRSKYLNRNQTPPGAELRFDETRNFNQLYICGIAMGSQKELWRRNLHLALVEAPGEQVEMTTYNDFLLVVNNARQISIPEPLAALSHLPVNHYRCKNFRFGVKYYGYPGICEPTAAG